MSIIICDECGYEAIEGDIFFEKVRCEFVGDDETYPLEVDRLCEDCENKDK